MTNRPPSQPAKDLRDPTVVAVEVTTIKGDVALLASQVSTGLGNVVSQLAALQGEFREQGRLLRSVESAQHDMQAHSTAVERLAGSIDRSTAENLSWRKAHEADNKTVGDRVTVFKGAMIGFGLLGATVMTIAGLWINAEFANIRRESNDKAMFLAEARGRITEKHNQDTAQLKSEIQEIKANRGLQ